MHLRSGTLYWPAVSPKRVVATRSPRRRRVDALIIGAGVTGALAAYVLSRAGARVAIIDKRRPVNASTPASTALLQYELDVPLTRLRKLRGVRTANAIYRASVETVQELASLCTDLGQDVELRRRMSLHLAVKPGDVRALRAEAAARAELGIACGFLPPRDLAALFHIDRPGSLQSDLAYEVNPVKLTNALLARAAAQGATLLEPGELDLSCLVQSERARPFHIVHPRGSVITASHVVLATGYETPEQFGVIRRLTELRSTYAIATAPIAGEPWPHRALLWDKGDPYFYARTTCDGRVLMGGLDDATHDPVLRDARIASKSRRLLARLRRTVPDRRFVIDFAWAGTFAQTSDGCPLIGEHPNWPRVHFALGYGGNGITFSLLAAQIIAGTITSKPHSAHRLFRIDRG